MQLNGVKCNMEHTYIYTCAMGYIEAVVDVSCDRLSCSIVCCMALLLNDLFYIKVHIL